MRTSKIVLGAFALTLGASAAQAAEPDNLILPQGFHAQVVTDVAPNLRHMAVSKDETIYASTRAVGRGGGNPGLLALHLDADHKAGKAEHFSTITGGTGIRIHDGALYSSSTTEVYRIALKPGETVPSATPQVVITGMPSTSFNNRIITFDDKGGLYLTVGSTGNICTNTPAKGAKPVALHPCPGVTNRGGVWRFSATKLGQNFPADGVQVATGLRDSDSMDYRKGDGTYLIMHDRAGTHDTWPDLVSEQDEDNLSEEMHRFVPGKLVNMGWPYAYYDSVRKTRIMAPEYGGDGKITPPPGLFTDPILAFHPSHAAPLDMLFYYGKQFPKSYQGGAFVVRHGGLGPQVPQGHNGYDVLFIPFTGTGKPGAPVEFAQGFAGPNPSDKVAAKAAYRPVGAAVGPDGSLYVSNSQKGRIWRIYYDGK